MSETWWQLIARRDRKVNAITQIQREIHEIDEQLEKNPPPANFCVAVWQPKKKPAKLPAMQRSA